VLAVIWELLVAWTREPESEETAAPSPPNAA
jgi:hypothetical protein